MHRGSKEKEKKKGNWWLRRKEKKGEVCLSPLSHNRFKGGGGLSWKPLRRKEKKRKERQRLPVSKKIGEGGPLLSSILMAFIFLFQINGESTSCTWRARFIIRVDPKSEETDVDATCVEVSAARTNTVCQIRIIFSLLFANKFMGKGRHWKFFMGVVFGSFYGFAATVCWCLPKVNVKKKAINIAFCFLCAWAI